MKQQAVQQGKCSQKCLFSLIITIAVYMSVKCDSFSLRQISLIIIETIGKLIKPPKYDLSVSIYKMVIALYRQHSGCNSSIQPSSGDRKQHFFQFFHNRINIFVVRLCQKPQQHQKFNRQLGTCKFEMLFSLFNLCKQH